MIEYIAYTLIAFPILAVGMTLYKMQTSETDEEFDRYIPVVWGATSLAIGVMILLILLVI